MIPRVLTLMVFLAASAACAQPELTIALSDFNLTGYPHLSIVAGVSDKATGGSITGLREEDFDIRVDGKKPPSSSVESVLAGGKSVGLALAVDASGSMKGEPLQAARSAIAGMLDRMGSGDKAMVVGFSRGVHPASGFTVKRDVLEADLAQLRAVGGTALYDAVVRACALAAECGCDRRAVVLLSDGADNSSHVSWDECLRRAAASGVPVYVIGLGHEIAEDTLSELASSTGGKYFRAASAAELQSIYQSIAQHLQSQYVIDVDVPSSFAPGSIHNLSVSVGGARRRVAFVAATAVEKAAGRQGREPGRLAALAEGYLPAAIGVLAGLNVLAVGFYAMRRARRNRR